MTNPSIGTIIKVGNSHAIVIPVAILRSLSIKRGDQVVFGVYDENTFAVRRILPEEVHKVDLSKLTF